MSNNIGKVIKTKFNVIPFKKGKSRYRLLETNIKGNCFYIIQKKILFWINITNIITSKEEANIKYNNYMKKYKRTQVIRED